MSSNRRTKLDLPKPRDSSTYRPFPSLPSDPAGVLSAWWRATRIRPVSAIEWDACDVPPRQVKDAMWFCFLEGTGRGWIGDPSQSFRLFPGGVMVVPQGAFHSLQPDKGNFRYISVHFYASIYGTVDLLTTIGLAGMFRSAPKTLFVEINQRLAREYALKALGWTQALEQGIGEVVLHLLRYQGHRLRLPSSPSAASRLLRLRPVLNLVESRLKDPDLRVTDLAKTLHVSKVTLRNMFHQAIGPSPIQFIVQRRIEEACLLLLHTDMPIALVAEACGMPHLPYFYRAFRHITQMTPGAYRTHATV
jgi:AraC-like DNA-binding protein